VCLEQLVRWDTLDKTETEEVLARKVSLSSEHST